MTIGVCKELNPGQTAFRARSPIAAVPDRLILQMRAQFYHGCHAF